MMINDFWCFTIICLVKLLWKQHWRQKFPTLAPWEPHRSPGAGQKQLFDESDHLVLVCHMFVCCLLDGSDMFINVFSCFRPNSEKHVCMFGMFLDKDIQGCVMTTFWQWHPCHRWVFIQYHVILPRTMLLVKRLHPNNCIFKGRKSWGIMGIQGFPF